MTRPLILVIEDDPDLSRLLTFDLQDGGFQVHHVPSAMMGLIAARELSPDVILLDLGLPDFAGDQVVARLRATGEVPIIILSARHTPTDKVRLLTLGADDYVIKPFHEAELLARVRVQLRRRPSRAVVCGAVTLFPHQRRVTVGNQEIRLSPKEFEILLELARRPGQVLTRLDLSLLLWDGLVHENSNLITVHIGNIRRKLREVGAYGVLRSVRGEGYALREATHSAKETECGAPQYL